MKNKDELLEKLVNEAVEKAKDLIASLRDTQRTAMKVMEFCSEQQTAQILAQSGFPCDVRALLNAKTDQELLNLTVEVMAAKKGASDKSILN